MYSETNGSLPYWRSESECWRSSQWLSYKPEKQTTCKPYTYMDWYIDGSLPVRKTFYSLFS